MKDLIKQRNRLKNKNDIFENGNGQGPKMTKCTKIQQKYKKQFIGQDKMDLL